MPVVSFNLQMWACPCSNKGLCVCFLSGFTTPRGSFIVSPPPCVGFLQTTRRESPRGYLSSVASVSSLPSKSNCLTWVTRATDSEPSLSAPWILVSYHSSTKGIIYCQAQGELKRSALWLHLAGAKKVFIWVRLSSQRKGARHRGSVRFGGWFWSGLRSLTYF